jgi:hypothetical protein
LRRLIRFSHYGSEIRADEICGLAALHSRAAATQPSPDAAPQADAAQPLDQTIARLTRESQFDIGAENYQAALRVIDQISALDPQNHYAQAIRQFVADRAQNQAQRGQRQAQMMLGAAPTILDQVLPEANFDSTPFTEVIRFLHDRTGANIVVNTRALDAAGVDRSTPISLKLRNVKLSKALSVILDMVGGQTKLGYKLDEGVITISTADQLSQNVTTQVYDVRDLIQPLPNSDKMPADLIKDLAKTVTDVVDTTSWKVNGGTAGAISTLAETGQMVVTQTPENQQKIVAVLDKIRQGQAQGAMKAPTANAGSDVAVVHPPADSPWKGTLPNGVMVELVGLSESPSAGRPWWKPDGSPLADAPYDEPLRTSFASPHQVTREIAVRLSNVPPGTVSTYWTLGTRATSAGGKVFTPKDAADSRILGECIGVPDTLTTSSVRIGITAGPWKTLSEDNNVTAIGSYGQGLPEGVIAFTPAVQKDNDVIMSISAELPPMDVRAVAVDHNGVEHAPNTASGGGTNNLTMMTIQFNNMTISQIASVRFQVRHYQWIEFKDVPLLQKPGGATGM